MTQINSVEKSFIWKYSPWYFQKRASIKVEHRKLVGLHEDLKQIILKRNSVLNKSKYHLLWSIYINTPAFYNIKDTFLDGVFNMFDVFIINKILFS